MLPVDQHGVPIYMPDGEVLEQYLWSDAELVIIQGPIGSGTSSCSCHRIVRLATAQAPDFDGVRRTRWLIFRESYRQLKKTTVKTWLEWFPERVFGDMVRSEPMSHQVRFPHPSKDGTTVDCEVLFMGIPDPETAEREAASLELTGFWCNEGQHFEKETINEVLSRCGRYPSTKNGPGATWHGGMVDLNAPVEGHWIPYMRGDIPVPAEMEAEAYERPDTWEFLVQPAGLIEKVVDGQIKYLPNPDAENQRNLKKSYMEQIRGKSRQWIQRRVLNQVGLYTSGKPVHPSFAEGTHVSKRPMQPIPGVPIIVGLDFGRDPAAVFCQNLNSGWQVYSELIGDNESADIFAPRVKRHLAQFYSGHSAEFYGDPRGGDGNQNVEITAFEVFRGFGMLVMEATHDNDPTLRRTTMSMVLNRRGGLVVDREKCMVLKNGMAGGYHFPKVKGIDGLFGSRPVKNKFSHVCEALENALLGGGEGYGAVMVNPDRRKPKIGVQQLGRASWQR